MQSRIQAQIIKEILIILRDPKSRAMLVIPPLLQLLIFSFASTLELRNVTLAIYNQDAGRWGSEYVQRVAASSFISHLVPVRNETALATLIDERKAMAALFIPQTFSRDVEGPNPGKIQVILDGRRGNAAQILTGYLNQILIGLNAELKPTVQGFEPPIIRHWFNPNLIYRWFVVPNLGGILVMFQSLMITALSIARERELGTFEQLLVSPLSAVEIIFTKIVPAIVIGVILGLAMALIGLALFKVPFTGSFFYLLPSLVLFILSNVGIGLMISSVCSTQQQAILGTFTIGVPAVLMSGFATPVENMPLVLQGLAEVIPLRHYLIILQGCFLKAMPLNHVLTHAWPMLLIALVTLSTAVVFVRSKLQ